MSYLLNILLLSVVVAAAPRLLWSLVGVNRESFFGRSGRKSAMSAARAAAVFTVGICFFGQQLNQVLLARWNRTKQLSAGQNCIHELRRSLALDHDTKCTISRRGRPSQTPCSLLPRLRGRNAPSANLTFSLSPSLPLQTILQLHPIRNLNPAMSSSSPSRFSSILLPP